MKNSDKNIQQKINELTNEDLPFDEAKLWLRLEEKLDKKQPKIVFINWQRWAAATTVAASILLFSGIGFWFFQVKSEQVLVEKKVKKSFEKSSQLIAGGEPHNQIVMNEKVKKTFYKTPFPTLPQQWGRELNKVLPIVGEDLGGVKKDEKNVEEKPEISPKKETIKLNEIQTKNVAFSDKNIDIKTPVLALKNEAELPEKPRRRFAFSIKIFPNLTSPDTAPSTIYAYGETANQIKIKL